MAKISILNQISVETKICINFDIDITTKGTFLYKLLVIQLDKKKIPILTQNFKTSYIYIQINSKHNNFFIGIPCILRFS